MSKKQSILNLIKHLYGCGFGYTIQSNLLLVSVIIYAEYRLQMPFWIAMLMLIYIVLSFSTYSLWRPDRFIHQAILANDLDKVRKLLNNNQLLANLISIQGYTSLHWACNSSTDEIVTILLEHGANPNGLSNEDQTPTHWAVSKSSLIKLDYLIQHGANLNIQDDKGKTPLHWAVQFNSLPTVTFLVEHGADRTICDENDKTPLELCRGKSGWEDIFNYLNDLKSN
jgi:ankyrin repeat protein